MHILTALYGTTPPVKTSTLTFRSSLFTSFVPRPHTWTPNINLTLSFLVLLWASISHLKSVHLDRGKRQTQATGDKTAESSSCPVTTSIEKWIQSFTHSFIPSFIQYILIEHPLNAQNCSMSWGCSNKKENRLGKTKNEKQQQQKT